MAQPEVQFVDLPGMKFVGIPVTSAFRTNDSARIDATRQQFLRRKDEIRAVVNADRYVCPSFVSEVLYTYFFCMEVSELADIPDGMIGFEVPPHTYAVTRSEQDPYEVIHLRLKELGKENLPKSLFWEVYRFDNPKWPEETDVYVPVKGEEEPRV